ncbi:hypothetical protein BBO99_00007283 [Phytophthora kernoviae]|uniref:Uncharacterized protein n=2 Tax=Phytophthora kernoviae TaxID=325452 RepID=A0A3R7HTR2_9STRA|nr:hypothetical protein G195_010258 [Phytophthora kernoviae 00238/432]KAG2514208.1 hypothetical protein JM18_007087 [Phytophthora kernoviae]KAG2515441.1 hypothetical protein JM16_007402 [Phytophthora kernoviae]RLM96083.1 hypothetical protein BBI17_001712 [Phytophthora kernoviae]RLN76779.1 hypothetical protein BBO99_00007283 [Phytophthora kernoviae]
MGGTLSVCGFANNADQDPQLYHQSKDFTRDFTKTTERGRSFSTATDSSVASILSNSEQLIPDIYMAKDIQVLSQRRQRQSHRYSGKNAALSSSRVSNSSRVKGTVKIMRNNTNTDAAESLIGKNYTFGMKTASSSFGYSDDDDPSNHHQTPPTAMNGRTNTDVQRRLSGRNLIKSSA